jgi:hypothetical protein
MYQNHCGPKGRGKDIHRSIHLLYMSLPEEECDNKEHRNDEWREDEGSDPSLNRTRRDSENE